MTTLFDYDAVLEAIEDDPPPAAPPRLGEMRPRDYQERCISKVLAQLEKVQSTLFVQPTGTGKTICFSYIAKKFVPRGRVLVLAHRQELIYQAQRKMTQVLGFEPDIEMAGQWADSGARVIISTVQTQGYSRGGRKNRFNPNEFSLVITDEGHHYCAEGNKSILEYYRQNKNIKIVGCTATPDRADEAALGQIYETVADEYEIPDAIQDGWLVPIQQRQVFVDSLDFSNVRTTAGDLNGADLAAIMEEEENLHKVADPLFQLAAGRQTLVFTASVAHAERLAEILNRHKLGCAQFVYANTPPETRAKMLWDFQDRKFQFLTNCMIATEGWDCPPVEVVGMARPTKSRALYCQMSGRATRPLTETNVDGYSTPLERRQAIAGSKKPYCELIDFVGNTGRHKLISAVDILGGKYPEEVQARARKLIAENEAERCSPEEMLLRAQQQLADEEHTRAEAAKRNLIIGKATFTSTVNKPFQVLGIQVQGRGWDKPATQAQVEKLRKYFYKYRKFDEELTENKAAAMLDEIDRRQKNRLATVRQAAILRRNGFDADMSRERAQKILDIIANNNWHWPMGVSVPE